MKKNKIKNLDKVVEQLDSIDVEISATHLNYVNANNVLYTLDAVAEGADSWLEPYGKPQLLHHDKSKDAIGRIVDYSIEDTATMKGEPKDFIKLTSRITDKEAITKVLNGIYYTCSVGSSTTKVKCSICSQNLTTDGLCEHEKGSMVDGKRAYWVIENISYKENSFVNNPADSYSRIVSIDIGDGPMAYDKFLEDKENILTDFFMEDDMTKHKLSADERTKLADSVFCGPGRTFPALDAAHVTAGLTLLKDSELDDSTKQKITSALYRKGKRFEIEPTDAELKDNSELLVFRMDDDFSDEEKESITTLFDAKPDADLPSEEETTTDDTETDEVKFTIADFDEIKKGKKDEIIAFCEFIVTESKKLDDTITELTEGNKILSDKNSEQSTILNSKEDEINKLLDNNAILSVDYKKSLVQNILDFKHVNENRDEEFKKYDSRKVDSLLDTLNDYRSDSANSIPRVEDETLTDSNESDDNTSEKKLEIDDSQKASRIDRFFKHNIITED